MSYSRGSLVIYVSMATQSLTRKQRAQVRAEITKNIYNFMTDQYVESE